MSPQWRRTNESQSANGSPECSAAVAALRGESHDERDAPHLGEAAAEAKSLAPATHPDRGATVRAQRLPAQPTLDPRAYLPASGRSRTPHGHAVPASPHTRDPQPRAQPPHDHADARRVRGVGVAGRVLEPQPRGPLPIAQAAARANRCGPSQRPRAHDGVQRRTSTSRAGTATSAPRRSARAGPTGSSTSAAGSARFASCPWRATRAVSAAVMALCCRP